MTNMNVVLAVKNYVTKMIEDSGAGMKALIMDKETIGIVSMVFAQSEILQKEVYLFENIEQMSSEAVKQVKGIIFVRPTEFNIQLLGEELKKPRFGKYYLYFSNTISKSDVKVLAESDEQECVCDIHELFADYYPLDCHHFTLNIWNCAYHFTWNQQQLTRCCQGLAAVALSMKKRPIIRYGSSSDMCKRLAESLNHQISREASLFDYGQRQGATVSMFIIDRRDDPVTPLMNQWTYEAMTHELIGIKNGRVSLASSNANVSKELSEIVLSPLNDQFYQENLINNFGEIGVNIKKLMEQFQAKTKSHQKVESIDDMKNFVENYPQFKKMSGTVSKHVTLVSELSKIVADKNLLEISELEQDIICQNDHNDVLERLRTIMKHQKVTSYEALRLAALYTLKYGQQHKSTASSLVDRANFKDGRRIVKALERYNLAQFEERDMKKAFSITKRFFKDLQGVENVYTQHKPSALKNLLDKLVDGRARESEYPTVGMMRGGEEKGGDLQQVVVFVVGGSTYEEIAYVEGFNLSNKSGITVVLGGTCVHSSRTFIDEVLFACAPNS